MTSAMTIGAAANYVAQTALSTQAPLAILALGQGAVLRAEQLVLLLFLIAPFVLHGGLRRLVAQLAIGQKAALFVFVCGTLFAQILVKDQYEYPNQREFFPFTRFAMFVSSGTKKAGERQEAPILFHHFEASMPDGGTIPINPHRLFPSTKSSGWSTKTTRLAKLIESENPSEQKFAQRQLEMWSASMLRAYRQLHPEGPQPSQLTFYEVTFDGLNEGSPVFSKRRNLYVFEAR